MTSIEIGDFDRGYLKIDIQETASHLYSLVCPLYLGLLIVAIPKYTQGKLNLIQKKKKKKKKKNCQPLQPANCPRSPSTIVLPKCGQSK